MTRKTKKTRKKTTITAEAKEHASRYRLLIEKTEKGRYIGSAFEMPSVVIGANSEAECLRLTRRALALAVQTMIDRGKQPPAASSDNKRHEQVNVRLTAMEKMRLEEASRRQGFRGLSDYIRNKALEGA